MVREHFEKESTAAVVRAAEPLGFTRRCGVRSPTWGYRRSRLRKGRRGGAGLLELAITAELAGRFLAPVPLIEAAAATSLLAALAGARVVEPLVAGELLATVALHPVAGEVARLLQAGAVADLIVVLRGDELLLVEQPVKPAAAIPNLGAMPLADCPLPADAVVLARGPAAVAAHRRAVALWEALTAAALAGLAAGALEIGTSYVLGRRAFGVLIGSFQTVQHRLADNATAIDGARVLAYEAAWAQDAGRPDADSLATMAFLFAAETAFTTASESLHQRAEDVHQHRAAGYPRVRPGPHRPRRAQAQRTHPVPGPDVQRRLCRSSRSTRSADTSPTPPSTPMCACPMRPASAASMRAGVS